MGAALDEKMKIEILSDAFKNRVGYELNLKDPQTMNEKINKIDKTVQRLTGKPGAMWEGAVKTIVTAVVGGIIGYVLFRLGLKA